MSEALAQGAGALRELRGAMRAAVVRYDGPSAAMDLQRAAASIAVISILGLQARDARAQGASAVGLTVTRSVGAEGCADEARLREEIASRLGRDPFGAGAARSIDVIVVREPRRWSATLLVRASSAAPAGVRTLVSESEGCEELSSALALAVALAADAEPAPTLPRRAPVPSPPTLDAWNRAEVFSLQALLSLGAMPSPSAGVALAMEGARGRWLRPWFGVSRTFESSPPVPSGAASFGFFRTAAWGGACFGAANARWSIDGCGALSLGLVTGVVRDTVAFEPVRPGDYAWFAASLAARGGVRLVGPLALELGAAPTVAIVRPSFRVEGSASALYATWPVSIDLWAAVRARFW